MIDLGGVSYVTSAVASSSPAATDDFWYSPAATRTASGMRITDDAALNYSAVWAATRLLSSSIGWLPLDLFRRLPKGGRELAMSDPRETLVHDRPNAEMGSMLWRCAMAGQQVNAGNAYSMIERRRSDEFPVALWPVHHTRVKLERDELGDLVYEIRNDNGAKPTYLDARDMLHVPSMMSDDGIVGKGVIRHARESIGFGLATERYGANWFQGQGIPRVVVTHPSKLGPEARMNFRKEWREIHGGSTGDRVALLAEGAKIEPLNLSQEDSQFLQTRQHNIEEIARWYGVPPHKLQHLLRATFSNIEEQNIDFVIDSLIPWLKIWEQELWRKLLTPEEQERMFFEFNVMALLRGNSAGRSAYFQSMLTNGVLNRNEVRAIENYNPVEGGDVFLVQGAMAPVDLLVEKMEAEIESMEAKTEAEQQSESEDETADDSTGVPDHVTQPAAAVVDAALTLVECTVERLTRKEAADATRAASRPGEFLAWMDAFYGRHEAYLIEDLSQPCKALRACGRQVLAESIAGDLVKESREKLLQISSECTAATLAKAVESEVATWSTSRPRACISRLREACGGEGSGVPGPCPIQGKKKRKRKSKKKHKATRTKQAKPSAKAIRAKKAHVLVNKKIQRYSEEHNEPRLAEKLGGKSEPDNKAYDVLVESSKTGKHGVELKTMVSNSNNKITMKGKAQDRKVEWERENKGTFHTVVYDDRKVYNAKGEGMHGDEADRVILYKRGGGSFRTGTMHIAKDHKELNKLIHAAEDDLPEAARPTKQWKQRQQKGKK